MNAPSKAVPLFLHHPEVLDFALWIARKPLADRAKQAGKNPGIREDATVIDILERLFKLAPGLACSLLGKTAEIIEELDYARPGNTDPDVRFWPLLGKTARLLSQNGSEVYLLKMRSNGHIETPAESCQRIYEVLLANPCTPGVLPPMVFKIRMAQYGIELVERAAPAKAEARPTATPKLPRPPKRPPATIPMLIAGANPLTHRERETGDMVGTMPDRDVTPLDTPEA